MPKDATRQGASQQALEQEEERAAAELNDDIPADEPEGSDEGDRGREDDGRGQDADPPKRDAEKEKYELPPHRKAFEDAVRGRAQEIFENTGVRVGPDSEEEADGDEGDGEGEDRDADAGGEGDADKGDAAKSKDAGGGDKPYAVLKVYGREVPVKSHEELIRLAQKGLAANEAFEEAARLRREAEERKRQSDAPPADAGGARRDAPAGDGNRGASPEQGGGSGDDEKIDIAELTTALRYGEEEEAQKALEKLVRLATKGRDTSATPALDEQTLSRLIRDTVEQSFELREYQRDLETLGNEFKEIFNDDDLARIAATRVHSERARELIELGYPEERIKPLLNSQEGLQQLARAHAILHRQGKVRSNLDVMRAACRGVHEKFVARAPAGSNGTAQRDGRPGTNVRLSGERTERKRSAPQHPTAAGGRGGLGAEPLQRQSASEIIAEIRRARGQTI